MTRGVFTSCTHRHHAVALVHAREEVAALQEFQQQVETVLRLHGRLEAEAERRVHQHHDALLVDDVLLLLRLSQLLFLQDLHTGKSQTLTDQSVWLGIIWGRRVSE